MGVGVLAASVVAAVGDEIADVDLWRTVERDRLGRDLKEQRRAILELLAQLGVDTFGVPGRWAYEGLAEVADVLRGCQLPGAAAAVPIASPAVHVSRGDEVNLLAVEAELDRFERHAEHECRAGIRAEAIASEEKGRSLSLLLELASGPGGVGGSLRAPRWLNHALM